ncbi:hypothetical protein K435DRAFT_878958 [Dendrothele bispora CBS 962.96]|uniref:Ser-Thr-rich glycosyl-phosphatidyl-inositol-anchored membrane family-domain-containing protein n=1 Tax=Dendrothele bispora (strain CBS 962.96) TaxID=1314807 RepID=A0A4S8KM03_DENBC|nr:hypothetical protein K435DRAFT_878958 [Dendrothele bispora CBS 962.96]
MFNKIALVAAVLPFVQALTWGAPPTDAVSTQQSTLTWTATDSDTVFSIELTHPLLNDKIAIANNVNPGDQSITVTWPVLIGRDGYTVQAVNIGNITDVFATSSAFNIAAPPSVSQSSTASGASGASGSATASGLQLQLLRNTAPTTSRTTPSGSGSNSASGSASQTAPNSSSSSAAPTSINGNGATSAKVNGGLVALAAAGAALFAL